MKPLGNDRFASLSERGKTAALAPFLPPGAQPYVEELLAEHAVSVRTSRPRRSKIGDHRGPRGSERLHRITVNNDLNPYAFLTTLLHEIAHLVTWERHRGRARRLKPHGPQWKGEFEQILGPVVAARLVPEDVATALARYMRDPTATTCGDRQLMLALSRYDAPDPGRTRVEDLLTGTIFRVENGQMFRKGPKLRSRYQCFECATGREYRVHAFCRVEVVAADPMGLTPKKGVPRQLKTV